ncbi:hypothetical protein [Streptomyces sp. NPDC050704]|uniref:hypothetical protein n=1 Tax=Streptomyces sp. NPDC050704 TaxID=3157219 RepID=UPI00342C75D0
MAKRKGMTRAIQAMVLTLAALTSTAAPSANAAAAEAAPTAIPEFWANGEVTGHRYIDFDLFVDQEPHQDLANATAYANNSCPSGRFCLVQRDPYGWGGFSVWKISGCDTFVVTGALDTFRANNRNSRQVHFYNANRQWIGVVGAGVKTPVTWNPIYYFATCR